MTTLPPSMLESLTPEEQAVLLSLYQRLSEGKHIDERTQKLKLGAGALEKLKEIQAEQEANHGA